MPNYRYVTATVEDLGGQSLKKFPIKVEHLQANSSPDGVFFPKRSDIFYTDTTGEARFRLWCNEEGDTASVYRFTLPNGDIFDTVVPLGTSDIDISVLRNGSTPTARPQYVTLVTHLRNELGGAIGLATPTTAGRVKINSAASDPLVYLKSEVDQLLTAATGVDFSAYYTKTEVNGLIPNLSPYYTAAQVNALIPDLEPYYLKTEVDALLAALETGDVDLTNYFTKSEVNALIPNLSPYYTKTEVNALIPSLTPYYLKTEVNSLIAGILLNGLADVTITNPVNGQSLVYQSGQWVNQTISAGVPDFSASDTSNMTYDASNSLTGLTVAGIPYTVTYGTNTTTITGGGRTQVITYDSAGNMISKVTT